jgi:hypothetical protein
MQAPYKKTLNKNYAFSDGEIAIFLMPCMMGNSCFQLY